MDGIAPDVSWKASRGYACRTNCGAATGSDAGPTATITRFLKVYRSALVVTKSGLGQEVLEERVGSNIRRGICERFEQIDHTCTTDS